MFTRAVDGWSAPSTNVILTAPDRKTGDGFGQSVTVDGDSIVVGAPWADTASGMDVGAAYVFTRPADGWSATDSGVKLTSSTAQSFDHFGTSVDIDGDTIAIGAPHALSRLVIRCGSVHLFTRPAGGWAESSDSFQFSTCDRVSEGFGYSVDLDGDSVVMGVPQFQSSDEDVGIAYVLTRASGVWSESSTVTMISNPSGDSGDRFGFSVAIAGSHAIIGVPLSPNPPKDTDGRREDSGRGW